MKVKNDTKPQNELVLVLCIGMNFSGGRGLFVEGYFLRIFSAGSGYFPGGLTLDTEKGQAKIKKNQ